MEKKRIANIGEAWEETGTITDEMIKTVIEKFDEIINYEIEYLNKLLASNKSHRAFGRLSRFLSFLNMIMQKRPIIQKFLENYIFELRKMIDLIAKGMEAKEYYFTLEMPTGISITMVFESKLSKKN